MAIPKILVVDDDVELCDMLAAYLAHEGFMVLTATNGAEIRRHIETSRIDLILLDVMLGEEDGITLCRELREEQDVPIIFVSTLSSDRQRVAGYEVGADDYIAKPFNLELLLARVKAVLRRGRRSASLNYRRDTAEYQFGGWRYSGRSDEVYSPNGVQVALSKQETRLLKVFLANPHIALTREEIIAAMDVTQDTSAYVDTSGRALDVLVGRLRSKIERNPKAPEFLKTERGVGYVFATDVDRLDT
ncbi:response regulator transcription factor [Alphaproteobacteria bacterium LSUCC0684]